ncbi:MAG TPA: lysylphosphatidylglycerol synthase transmembrane domain-containing protein [Geobacteraceae bacterium]
MKLLVGSGISLFFLVMLFRKIELDKLAAAFREMDWRLLGIATVITLASYIIRAVRWRYLLLPLKRTAFGNLVSATFIGYMANNLLPARLGEFVRAYVLADKEELETSAVFASLVMDRLWDGFSVLLILVATFFTVKLPPGMEKVQQGLVMGGYVTLALYLGVIVFLVLLKRLTNRTLALIALVLRPFPKKLTEKVIPILGSFIAGIRFSGRPSDWLALLLSSAVIWASATWPLDLLLQAFGIHLPITAAMFIMVFLVFAVMVPASPGYIGTYHAACVYGLMAFNVPREKALSIAMVVHATNFFPTVALGFFFLWYNKISLKNLTSTPYSEE